MMLAHALTKKTLALLALSGTLLFGLPVFVLAQGNSGFTIFSGVDRKDILDYYLQFGGFPNEWDRYKLYIPAKKLTQGASRFYISYPANFDGKFDTQSIDVRTKSGSVPLESVVWDKESRFLEISLAQPIDPNTKVDIVLSNVKNPTWGTYYFVCDVTASGDIPLRLYVGTWIVSIQR
ncbi:DUF2808 domain-containing protein [Synechocystis sp. LKSZ1]|uniref:DUF2808 domain-containing protein n=1 Tax=Synechocystis sp. LKSZ1 TaxID=3144951 RepID=UPI00336BE522